MDTKGHECRGLILEGERAPLPWTAWWSGVVVGAAAAALLCALAVRLGGVGL
jgi:hypothetical protein